MCGIFALLAKHIANKYPKTKIYSNMMKIKQRGPDSTKYFVINENLHFGFHRLAINDLSSLGMQPFVHNVTYNGMLKRIHDENSYETFEAKIPIKNNNNYIITQCNGEIYNAFNITKTFNFQLSSKNDCEIIPYLYNYFDGDISKVCHSLDGVFAFILYDTKKDILYAARDPIGIRPVFIGKDDGSIFLSSEAKSIIDFTSNIEQLPSGNYWQSDKPNNFTKWFDICDGIDSLSNKHELSNITPMNYEITNENAALIMIKDNLITATKKRLMSERQIGSLLSGGVDSSLISALLNKYNDKNCAINTYTVGMKDSPDIYYALRAAEYIKSNHHSVEFTFEEGFNLINNVIYALESYDVHSIRGGIALYILGDYIKKNTNDVVIYCGIGSDELMQGYLYFHNQPSDDDDVNMFGKYGDIESKRLLNNLLYFDNLIVDRLIARNGLEIRVPFLDKLFVKNVLKIAPILRAPKYKKTEKYLLRKAFENDDLIPNDILWREKEQMDDGISNIKKSFDLLLKEYVNNIIGDKEYNNICNLYQSKGLKIPISKEAYYYRKIYNEYFGVGLELIPYFFVPKWSNSNDPSARSIVVNR